MDDTTIHVHTEAHLDMCGHGCASGQAGHGLISGQEVVAAAAPSAWRDGIVIATAGGLITVALLDGGVRGYWHHTDAGLVTGEPVAVHPIAGVLAAGATRLSVRAAA